MRTNLALDALRMALTRRAAGADADVELIHHSDAGSQLELKGGTPLGHCVS